VLQLQLAIGTMKNDGSKHGVDVGNDSTMMAGGKVTMISARMSLVHEVAIKKQC